MSAGERVAFQGARGAFSEIAVRELTGAAAEPVPYERFEEVFSALADHAVDAAVIPIENTLHGSVHENYDHLLKFQLPIVGETLVRIEHSLMVPPGVEFAQLTRVYSHPVALNQCLDFFRSHPQLTRMPFYDTAGSVKMVIEERLRDAGAIASYAAAAIYGADVLRQGIEDDRQNFTRFFLLRRAVPEGLTTTDWKTSLVFSMPNTPGSLFRAMSAFALRDISLTKIESRPLRGKPWEYLFYLDLLGRPSEVRVAKALGHLEEVADTVRVLGSYPRG